MTADGPLRCPMCGECLSGGPVSAPAPDRGDQVRAAVDCPQCEAALTIVVESALPDALGVDISVEQRDAGELPDVGT